MIRKSNTKIILKIAGGAIFEGTFEQFSNCFFNVDNYPTVKEKLFVIKDWCKKEKMKLQIIKIKLVKKTNKKHKHDWYLIDFNTKSPDGTGPAEETCDCGATRKITIEKYKG